MLYSLIGKKIGMTQIYDGDNTLVSVTVIEAGPCSVIQVKTTDSDGYNAIQIGFGNRRAKRIDNGLLGHLDKAGAAPLSFLGEVSCKEAPEQKVGDVLTVAGFTEGQKVDIVGSTKGRGFQGVVRRFGFKGGPASHGSTFHRRGGSFGQCQWPGRVDKGRKMPGHMGAVQRTVQNLKVVKILEDKNILLVKGSVSGAMGTRLLVRSSKKGAKIAPVKAA